MSPFGQTAALLHLFLCGLCGATKVRVFPKQLEMRVDMNSGFDNERPGVCRDRRGDPLRRQARIACWSGCRLILDQLIRTRLCLARPRPLSRPSRLSPALMFANRAQKVVAHSWDVGELERAASLGT